MKTLILVRHGKSSWDYQVADQDRPLQERGINDGHLVGSELKSKDVKIDAAFSSPANRALHTCMIVLRKLDFPLRKLQITKELYDFSGEDVLRFVRNLDNQFKTVLIFGHNYAFTHVANSLGSMAIDNVPTTGMVQINFIEDRWESIKKGNTERTIFPKQLKK
ncbi:SixA phosphatase family protein [Sediminicola arcticus]|jgi:phosphohistidine phosphatase|uniref:phosphoglycerate mutase (2,3-diphosphoglycerate-dependent) n=1 Tax=Sediminicola arcticus TaxID=1574308 RepID=A0ABV2SV92_9FLAO